MKKLILVFFIFQSLFAFCQDGIYYLEGTLGKSIIYVKINVIDPSEPNAIYFYQSSLKDIHLEGTRKNNDFTFVFQYRDTIYEKFNLKKVANNHFEGTWSNDKGKSYPVNLAPINFSNYKATLSKDYTDEKLNYVKYKFIEFEKQKTTVYSTKEMVWYSEKHCDVAFFRLGDSFSDKNKNAVNPSLEKIHIENTLDQLNCSSDYDYNKGGNIEYSTSLNFFKFQFNWF